MQPNLTLANIARNPSESVRPDLWPTYGVYPTLGIQGYVLHDVAGRGTAGLVSAPWGYGVDGHCVLINSGNDHYINHVNYTTWQPLMSGSSPWTLNINGFWDWGNSGSGGSVTTANTGYINSASAGTNRLVISHAWSYGSSYWNCGVGKSWNEKVTRINGVAVHRARNLEWFIRWDGEYLESWVLRRGEILFVGSKVGCVQSDYGGDAVHTVRLPNGSSQDGQDKNYTSISLHHKALSLDGIRALSADPLLPLRRRAIQPYWVLDDVPVGVFKPFEGSVFTSMRFRSSSIG